MRVAFERFIFDSGTRQLLHGGRPVKLTPKAVDVLALLLEHRPNVVTKEALFERAWPGTAAGDGPLTVVIAEIRGALGDDAKSPAFVRTVSRSGYAFCGTARDLPGEGAPPRRAAARCWLVWNGERLQLAPGENVIGRRPDCAAWIDAPGVSRLHARIDVFPDRAVIVDLGSVNGTVVGNTMLEEARDLVDGDVIQLGTATLTFHSWSQQALVRTERLTGRRRG